MLVSTYLLNLMNKKVAVEYDNSNRLIFAWKKGGFCKIELPEIGRNIDF